jgi:TPP-dependent pyruvate/acetoin dehydrogenase alpha subunit
MDPRSIADALIAAERERKAIAPFTDADPGLDAETGYQAQRLIIQHRLDRGERLIGAMYRQGELLGSLYTGHWHEAIAVGTASALRPTDVIAPLHRDLGAHLWRGLEPWQVMASFMGKATSPTGGRDALQDRDWEAELG